jgi:hypothetical protein
VHLGALNNSHRLSPKIRLVASFGDVHYNAYGLQRPDPSNENEEKFAARFRTISCAKIPSVIGPQPPFSGLPASLGPSTINSSAPEND